MKGYPSTRRNCGKTGKTPKKLCSTQEVHAGKPGLSRGKTPNKPQTGSRAWSGRVIFARDLSPIVTILERSPTGPRLVIESETFTATLPATPHILKLLARKLEATAKA